MSGGGVYSADGTTIHLTAGQFSAPLIASGSGAVFLISADEAAGTDVNTTVAETTSKTYALGNNSYSKIIVESDIVVYNDYSTAGDTVTVKLYIGNSSSARAEVGGDSSLTGVFLVRNHKLLRFSAAQTAAATVKVTVTPAASQAGMGAQALSLRVYGVL